MKNRLQILIVLTMALSASATVFAQQATRVNFYKNSTSAVTLSNLRGFNDKKVYVIRVRKGQTAQHWASQGE